VIVGGLIVGFAVRYRRKPGDDELPPQIHGNTSIEVVWTVIPTLIVLVLFVLSALELGRLNTAPASPRTMTIDVTGFQWQWRFAYPDFKTKNGNPLFVEGTSGQTKDLPTLHLPLNVPVHFHLESQDVIHSFFIPVFLFKRDVIPGHPNHFTITATRTGTFTGHCSELCGLYHAKMLFTLKVVTPQQFQAYMSAQQAAQSSSGSTQ
jgi:cytochrome c oxidase subunit II